MSTVKVLETPAAGRDRSSQTTAAGISWLQFSRHRTRLRQRWPHALRLPIVRSLFHDAAVHCPDVRSVLDVGATDRLWEPMVRTLWPHSVYRSLDIDRTNEHDYYDWSDVDRSFDLVACFEVIEHVPAAASLDIVGHCASICRPGGYVAMSVPNVLSPGYPLEFTHQTCFTHLDLGGLLSWHGLEVIAMSRVFFGTTRRLLLHQRLLGPLHRALNVDFCQSILALARRPQ